MSRPVRPLRTLPGTGPSAGKKRPRMTTAARQGPGVPAGLVMSEAQFQARILDYCRLRGLLVFHDHDSRRNQPGWPDLVITTRPVPARTGADLVRQHTLFRELKTDTGKVTLEQEEWILALRASGHDAGVWRPADWVDHIVPQLHALTARRARGGRG